MKFTDPFSTNSFYHIYNKSIDTLVPFSEEVYSAHLLNLIWFYRSNNRKVSFSDFKNATEKLKSQFTKDIIDPKGFQIEILAFCIMPNHYHFLLRQNMDRGIFQFMNNVINAFTRSYNLIKERRGPIFIPEYKSRLIHTEEQLIHVSRYIHLNPFSSGIVKTFDRLFNYRFSSLREYLYHPTLVNTSFILNSSYFLKNKTKYKLFITNHAEYQKTLEYIKHVKKWW